MYFIFLIKGVKIFKRHNARIFFETDAYNKVIHDLQAAHTARFWKAA